MNSGHKEDVGTRRATIETKSTIGLVKCKFILVFILEKIK